ncbi:Nucleoporin protein Ndc1-Nup [Quillaja saponaria]|uniref:Nucleoporin protein Ndc1-Nup n=1 Tax=Quillaja saponaria TaxID=32244 RepID=A0AAD7PVL4_QUISA|nr:Nucleoporin protein Ndc1-Nup [Quillaja saponaria]
MSSQPPLPPDLVLKNRFLGFLIWQSIPSTVIYIFLKRFISAIARTATDSIDTKNSSIRRNSLLGFVPSFIGLLTIFTFHLSQLLFSVTLSIVSSPQSERPASLFELVVGLVRLLFVSGGRDGNLSETGNSDFRRRAKVSLSYVLFVAACAASGFIASSVTVLG